MRVKFDVYLPEFNQTINVPDGNDFIWHDSEEDGRTILGKLNVYYDDGHIRCNYFKAYGKRYYDACFLEREVTEFESYTISNFQSMIDTQDHYWGHCS